MPRTQAVFSLPPMQFPCDVLTTMTNTLLNLLFYFRWWGGLEGEDASEKNTSEETHPNSCASSKGMPFA